jgi:hypothetical protein
MFKLWIWLAERRLEQARSSRIFQIMGLHVALIDPLRLYITVATTTLDRCSTFSKLNRKSGGSMLIDHKMDRVAHLKTTWSRLALHLRLSSITNSNRPTKIKSMRMGRQLQEEVLQLVRDLMGSLLLTRPTRDKFIHLTWEKSQPISMQTFNNTSNREFRVPL